MIEARLLFRWVLLEEKVYQLQFQTQEGLYLDWLHVKKSQIPRSGNGLYASVDIPKNTFFSIYLGREVLVDNPKRKYIIEMKKTFVQGSKRGSKWIASCKGRRSTIVDALMSDSDTQVALKSSLHLGSLHLGSHLMNDPKFGGKETNYQTNVVFNALLEAVTTKYVLAGEELFVNYNR